MSYWLSGLYYIMDRIKMHESNDGARFTRMVKSEFARTDVNGSGSLDFQEVKEMLERLNISNLPDAELMQLFNLIDLDRSGTIEYHEFQNLITILYEKPELKSLFDIYAQQAVIDGKIVKVITRESFAEFLYLQ